MIGFPPGMAQFITQLGLTNPAQLAAMAAAKGIQPPALPMGGNPGNPMAAGAAGGALPMAPGPTSGMSPTQMVNPTGAPTAAGGVTPPMSVPQPGVGAQLDPSLMMQAGQVAMQGLAPPTAAGAGAGGGNAPAPFIPGALQPQTIEMLNMLMKGRAQPPTLGSLIMGG